MFKQPTSAREELAQEMKENSLMLGYDLTKEARASWQGRVNGLRFALSIIDKWEAKETETEKCQLCNCKFANCVCGIN